MSRKVKDPDFHIYVDPSCLSAPMDDESAIIPQSEEESRPEPAVGGDEELAQSHEPVGEAIDEPKHDRTLPAGEPSNDLNNHKSHETAAENKEEEDSGSAVHIEETPEVADTSDELESSIVEVDEEEHSNDKDAAEHATGDDTEAQSEVVDENETALREADESVNSDVEEEFERTAQAVQAAEGEDVDDSSHSRRESITAERKTSLGTEALIQAAARDIVAKLEERHAHTDSFDHASDADDHSISGSSHAEDDIEGSATGQISPSAGSRRESSESQIHHTLAGHQSSDGEGGDNSSHHEAEDDVFSDRSPRSSMGSGSYDGAGEEEDKEMEMEEEDTQRTPDARMSMGRSPRVSGVSVISGLSQYEKEEFIPATRETPRMPFRTPSSVRAMQMSSPPPSVFSGGSPRSGKRTNRLSQNGFPTISRLGSPNVSAQYSPKRNSTPPRFKSRKEAPLVLLHVTVMPLRWPWGDVLNNLETTTVKGPNGALGLFQPSDDLKSLRHLWRQLQDRIGDTELERGVLLSHPQNDYEVLEERLLEALELPLRRRARILECGHYLGPTNEMSMEDDEDSEDEYMSQYGESRVKTPAKHWCTTCRSEIQYEELGRGRVFRVKVYASNGLMRAGAWAACWKEMERVDIEVEPIVERQVLDELEHLAALQIEEQERQHDLDMAMDEELEHLPGEEPHHLPTFHTSDNLVSSPQMSSPLPAMHVTMHASPHDIPAISPAVIDSDPIEFSPNRQMRDEERLREIYGHTPPSQQSHDGPSSTRAEPTTTHPSQHHEDSYIPPPTPPSPSEEAFERRERRGQRQRTYQNASLQDLVVEAAKVLMRDRKNVAIVALSFFVLLLALRPASPRPSAVIMHTPHESFYHAEPEVEQPLAAIEPVAELTTSVVSVEPSTTAVIEPSSAASSEPCESKAGAVPADAALTETVTQKKVIRVFETVTETVKVTATEEPANEATEEPDVETLYEYETVKVTVSASAPSSAETSQTSALDDTDILEDHDVDEPSQVPGDIDLS